MRRFAAFILIILIAQPVHAENFFRYKKTVIGFSCVAGVALVAYFVSNNSKYAKDAAILGGAAAAVAAFGIVEDTFNKNRRGRLYDPKITAVKFSEPRLPWYFGGVFGETYLNNRKKVEAHRLAEVKDKKNNRRKLPAVLQPYLKEGAGQPPAKDYDRDTTSVLSLYTDPGYWWFPGNIYYDLFSHLGSFVFGEKPSDDIDTSGWTTEIEQQRAYYLSENLSHAQHQSSTSDYLSPDSHSHSDPSPFSTHWLNRSEEHPHNDSLLNPLTDHTDHHDLSEGGVDLDHDHSDLGSDTDFGGDPDSD